MAEFKLQAGGSGHASERRRVRGAGAFRTAPRRTPICPQPPKPQPPGVPAPLPSRSRAGPGALAEDVPIHALLSRPRMGTTPFPTSAPTDHVDVSARAGEPPDPRILREIPGKRTDHRDKAVVRVGRKAQENLTHGLIPLRAVGTGTFWIKPRNHVRSVAIDRRLRSGLPFHRRVGRFFSLPHRALAAFRAIRRRCRGVRALARATPPFRVIPWRYSRTA